MKRFGRWAAGVMLVTAWTAGPALAQTTDSPWSAQVDVAATLGHTSDSSVGAEVVRRLSEPLEVFIEFGHMGNITSQALEDRAAIIGSALGGTANPIQKATYYDVGLRYRLMPDGRWNPYIAVGFGAARVKTETAFTVDGVQLTDAQLADLVQLGVDLDGSITKAFLVLGGGVQIPFKNRWFLDGSFRYGRVLARSGEIEGDKGVNTLRLQLGLGIRF